MFFFFSKLKTNFGQNDSKEGTKRKNSGHRKSSHGITKQGIGDKGKCRRMDALPHSQKQPEETITVAAMSLR
jgi:hypothetical protein